MDGSRARALLGVPAHATTEEVRGAFRRAARGAHPDVGGDAGAFRTLVSARDVLLAAAPAVPARRWVDCAPAEGRLDVFDVVRQPPAAAAAPAPDFEAVLAAALAA